MEGIAAGDRDHLGGRDGGAGPEGCQGGEGDPRYLQASPAQAALFLRSRAGESHFDRVVKANR
jgi:hypothetical protein